MSLTFDTLKPSHYPYIEKIIREVWGYDDFTTPKVANQLAKSFFAACLTDYTDSQVALLNDKPVGVILIKNEKTHKRSLKSFLKFLLTTSALLTSKEGRLHRGVFAHVETIDHELLTETNITYDGQISLFAVSKESQGLGVGKQLFQYALQEFKKEQINNFYLYTDTTCNYGFYDHQGMTIRAQKDHHFTQLPDTPPTTFFLYDYRLT